MQWASSHSSPTCSEKRVASSEVQQIVAQGILPKALCFRRVPVSFAAAAGCSTVRLEEGKIGTSLNDNVRLKEQSDVAIVHNRYTISD